MHRILIQIGPVTVYTYGLFVALAFLVTTVLIMREASSRGMDQDKVFDCLLGTMIGGMIGGRVLYVLINHAYFTEFPLHAFMLNRGGLAFQGAFPGAFVGCALCARFRGLSLLTYGDLIAPFIPLGHAIGRIGCFFNGCCYGRTTERFFRVIFPGENVARVPIQLYSAAALLLLFFLLLYLGRRRPPRGTLFGAYLVAYSFIRFALDLFREDTPSVIYWLKLSQLISLGTLTAGIFLIIFSVHRNRRDVPWSGKRINR